MEDKNVDYMPDQKLHRNISFVKSIIRILGCFALTTNVIHGAILFGIAEVIGIIEEIV